MQLKKNEIVNRMEFEQAGKQYLLLGEIAFLTESGDTYTVDDLAGDFNSQLDVLALDSYGRLTTTTIHSFQPEIGIHEGVNLSFVSGLRIRLDSETCLSSATGEKTAVNSLEFSSVVLGAIYTPSQRTPVFSTDEVLHKHLVRFDEPATLFSFSSTDPDKDVLITQRTSDNDCPLVAVKTYQS